MKDTLIIAADDIRKKVPNERETVLYEYVKILSRLANIRNFLEQDDFTEDEIDAIPNSIRKAKKLEAKASEYARRLIA